MPPSDRGVETAVLLKEIALLVKILPPCPPRFRRGVDFYSSAELPGALYSAVDAFIRANRYQPSLLNPRTFNEKIFYSKFLTPFAIPTLADKIYAHRFVAGLAGRQFVPKIEYSSRVPEWAVDHFRKLPAGRFLLKANNASGSITTSVSSENRRAVIQGYKDSKKKPFGRTHGEWHYSTIQPRYFVEERLPPPEGAAVPLDYKFYCFGGKTELVHVDEGRFHQHRRSLYTPDFEYLETGLGVARAAAVKKPQAYREMIDFAETIAKAVPHPFCRVDLYYDSRFGIKFGEVTLTPGNAMFRFSDENLAKDLGRKFKLAGRDDGDAASSQLNSRDTEST